MKLGRTITAEVQCSHVDDFAGTHRVQRLPFNDKRGRRHTSTATVAVVNDTLVSIEIDPGDVDEFTTIGSGKGGQHRQKNATAVTLVHRPTGTRVHSERQRSLWQNQQDAWARLREILTDQARAAVAAGQNDDRNRQITSGERPVKSYTWNYTRDEVIDHQTGYRWRLRDAFKGRLDRSGDRP